MKKKAIKCFCGILVTGMLLAGCGSAAQVNGSGENGNAQAGEVTVNNGLELNRPTGMQADYASDTEIFTMTWNSVEYADCYEVDYGTGTIFTTGVDPIIQIQYLSEGETYVFKVRAKHEDGNHVDYSDWAEYTYEIPVYLATPANIRYDLDGTKFYVIWDAAEKAEQYEVEFTDGNGDVKTALMNGPRGTMSNIVEGRQYDFRIRSVKTIGDHSYYSDWVESSYTVPQLDYTDETFSYTRATMLDYNRLIKWAEGRGYNYKTETKEGLTIVDVSVEDNLNKGFWSKAGDVVGAVIGGYIGGYGSEVYDKVNNDFSSAESTFRTIMENEGMEDYLNSVDESADQSGKATALQYGLQALYADRRVHFIYYYKDTDCGAICSESIMLKNNRENYEQNNYGDFTKGEDGGYHLKLKSTGQTFRVYCTNIIANTYEYWDIITYNDRSRP